MQKGSAAHRIIQACSTFNTLAMQHSSPCHNAIVLAIALFFSIFAKSELVPPDSPVYSEMMDYPAPGDVIKASCHNHCTNQVLGEAARIINGAWHPSMFSKELCMKRCTDPRFWGIRPNIEAVPYASLHAERIQNSMPRFATLFGETRKRIRLEPRELESRSGGLLEPPDADAEPEPDPKSEPKAEPAHKPESEHEPEHELGSPPDVNENPNSEDPVDSPEPESGKEAKTKKPKPKINDPESEAGARSPQSNRGKTKTGPGSNGRRPNNRRRRNKGEKKHINSPPESGKETITKIDPKSEAGARANNRQGANGANNRRGANGANNKRGANGANNRRGANSGRRTSAHGSGSKDKTPEVRIVPWGSKGSRRGGGCCTVMRRGDTVPNPSCFEQC